MDVILKYFASLNLIEFLSIIAGLLVAYLVGIWILLPKVKKDAFLSKFKKDKTKTPASKRKRYDDLDDITLNDIQHSPQNAFNNPIQNNDLNYKPVVIESEDGVTIRAGSATPQPVQNPTSNVVKSKVESQYNINLMDELDKNLDTNVNLSSNQSKQNSELPTKNQKPTDTQKPTESKSFDNLSTLNLNNIEDDEEMNSQVLTVIESVSNEVRRLRQEVEKMREQNNELRTEVAKIKELQASQAPHTQAIMLAKQGVQPQDIVERCGISQAEAELIMSIYHK